MPKATFPIAFAILVLAACGQAPEVPGPPAPIAAASEPDIVVVPGSFQSLLTQARADRGLGPLRRSPRLDRAAQGHANDMAQAGFFSHTGSDGRSVGARVAATGYGFCWVSENISWNRKSEAEAFARWMASPGHRANMLAREPREYGLAVAPGNYRVLVMATPGC